MASLLQAGAQEATRIPDRRLVHALQVSEPGVGRATRTRYAPAGRVRCWIASHQLMGSRRRSTGRVPVLRVPCEDEDVVQAWELTRPQLVL